MINTIYSINAKPFLGEDEKYHYLYQITNIANGKIYVGIHSTTNLNDGYSGSGKVIIRAIEKSGEENFIKEIKCFYKNREELAKAENEIVNEEFIKDENTYNLVIGGGMRDRWSDESFCSYMSETMKEYWKDEEYRNSHIEILKGNWNDEHIRSKMAESIKRSLNTPESKEKRSIQQREVWKQEELREKSRQNAKKQWADPEIREKMINSLNTEEVKRKQSEKSKENWQRQDYQELISKRRKEKWEDPDFRERMMKHLQSEETRKRLSESATQRFKGKPLSEEHKKKIGDSQRGKTMTEEQRKRVSEGRKNTTVGKIAVLCLDENFNIVQKYKCMNEVVVENKINYRTLLKDMQNCTITNDGYYYCREKDYDQFVAYMNGETNEKPVIEINKKQSEKLKGQGNDPVYKIDQDLNIIKVYASMSLTENEFPGSYCTLLKYVKTQALYKDGYYYIKKKDYESFIQSNSIHSTLNENLFGE